MLRHPMIVENALYHLLKLESTLVEHKRYSKPRNVAVLTDFYPTFGLSFSLISPSNLTSKVLRPRIRSRRDPLRVKQRGTTSSS
ncbi:hypothetical protein PRUPE_2G081500 [Prunus persica]|uniref:Uncharacterized protein n=1 Tax=Prunus persica TaxID=3760 RepID=A0A251QD49_PRUPE|nr:hypothetical protein PRUPE_2G081500 [Prunus persica]